MYSGFELGNTVYKFVEDVTLLETDKCIVKVFKDSLVLPLTFGNVQGYFIHGKGRLVVDTIIETRKGAFGKPTDKELKEPFIAFGDVGEIKEKTAEAEPSSLTVLGYRDVEALREKAEEICREVLRKTTFHRDFEKEGKRVFYFLTEGDSYDVLVSKDNGKLVYVSKGKVFVFSDRKSLFTGFGEVVVSKGDKTVIVANGNVFVEKGAT